MPEADMNHVKRNFKQGESIIALASELNFKHLHFFNSGFWDEIHPGSVPSVIETFCRNFDRWKF